MINIKEILLFIKDIKNCSIINNYTDFKIVYGGNDNPLYLITKDYLYDEFFDVYIYGDEKMFLKYIKNNLYKNILINKQYITFKSYKIIKSIYKQYNDLTLEEFIIIGINNNLKFLEYLDFLPEEEQSKLQYLINANKFDLI